MTICESNKRLEKDYFISKNFESSQRFYIHDEIVKKGQLFITRKNWMFVFKVNYVKKEINVEIK